MADRKIQVAKVAFKGNTEVTYDYLTDFKLKPEDIVVVDTATGPSLGKVVSLTDELTEKATKWVIWPIDYAGFQKTLDKRNKLVAEERKRREEEALADLLG